MDGELNNTQEKIISSASFFEKKQSICALLALIFVPGFLSYSTLNDMIYETWKALIDYNSSFSNQ